MTSGIMPISMKSAAAPPAAITVKSEKLISQRSSLSLGTFPYPMTGFSKIEALSSDRLAVFPRSACGKGIILLLHHCAVKQ